MIIFSPLLYALSSNGDAIVIGINYGAKKIKFNFISNIMIAFIAAAGTFISMLFGKYVNTYISPEIGNFLGSFLLVLFGLYMFIEAMKKKSNNSFKNENNHRIINIHYLNEVAEHPEIIDKNHSNIIELKEAMVLGGLLSLNNIGMGIGASITGLNIHMTTIFSLVFSVVLLQLGCYMGQKIKSVRLSTGAEIISASIIIILGLFEAFL